MKVGNENERIEAIKRYLVGDRQIDICKDLGKSKPWFMKWVKRYRTGKDDWYKDLPKSPLITPTKIDESIESVIIKIRESLMNGTEDSMKYEYVGAESIQYRMEKLGYDPSTIPSISTIKRIITRNHLRVNKKERYKRVKSKGRYTIIHPEFIDEMHQMDFVGPRYIKGFGPFNSLHLKDVIGRQVAGNQYIGKSMDNVMEFLLDYWKHHPIPRYIQTDNGMSFAGDFVHPRKFSRYVRLCLFVGIEVVFIAPAKPWMNGTIEEFNKEFDRLFWKREAFTSLSDIQKCSKVFYDSQNDFNKWKGNKDDSISLLQKRILPYDFEIDLNNIPLVSGSIHFIRMVDSKGDINVLNEPFHIGNEYIGEYTFATIDTGKKALIIRYTNENMKVTKINQFHYKFD
jgi:putative transposase